MPRVLHILDLKPFIHAGSVNKNAFLSQTVYTGSTWRTQTTPMGGTSLVFNTLYNIMGKGDIVVCTDRNPTIKKDMYPDYKSNRHNNQKVKVDTSAAEYILGLCGITVIARAGYEADDIIYTLVKKLHDNYDEIYVYTGDSDLYFLVDEKVSIRPSSSRAHTVTMDNYESLLRSKGIRYNTVTVQKILKGDSSDCIPGLPIDEQKILADTLYLEKFMPLLGDKDTVKYWVSMLVPRAVPQVDLVFPLYVDNIPTDFSMPNKDLIRNIGASMNNRLFRGMLSEDFDVKPIVEDMQSKGYYIEEDN